MAASGTPGDEFPLEIRGPLAQIRGPLVSWLTQWYIGSDVPRQGDDVHIPDELLSVLDLTYMFLEYVRETEARYGGDFQEFLQRQAIVPYLGSDQPSAFP